MFYRDMALVLLYCSPSFTVKQIFSARWQESVLSNYPEFVVFDKY